MIFARQVQSDVERLFAESEDVSDQVFSFEQIDGLPDPVQRYFRYALKDGQHYINYARLRHTGTFRNGENQGWMPISGEEYFTTQKPGFVWYAKAKPNAILWFSARDMYSKGKGNMLVKMFSMFTIVNAEGKEIDQGALARFLAEAAWFPTALLPSDYLRWEPIDSNSAKATITDSGTTTSAVFYFNEKGEITRFEADRYMEIGGQLEKWDVYCREYKMVDGVGIPTDVEAVWYLETGEFSYAKFRLTEIEFNNPSVF